MIRVGRSARKNSRSASCTASAQIMGHEQRRHLGPCRQRHQFVAQPVGGRLIERHEGLVEQQKIRIDRERARDRNAARQPERQFAGVAGEVRAKAESLDQFGQVDAGTVSGQARAGCSARRCAMPTGAAPETPCRGGRIPGCDSSPVKIGVEPGCDLQDGGLAAAGRADQRAERSGLEPKIEAAHDLDRGAVGRKVALGVDAKLKQGGAASGLRVVQAVARQDLR